jgi:hypothetical protein
MSGGLVELALRPYPGDELLRRLLWLPLKETTAAEVWGYFSSRPRRYSLEPALLRITNYRYVCRCRGEPGLCRHCGSLELQCQLASRTCPAERASFWLRAEDVMLNREHAAVMALYAAFRPPPEGERRHGAYRAVLRSAARTRSTGPPAEPARAERATP